MKIVVDVFGGDKAPEQILLGCVDALEQDSSLMLILCGKEDVIAQFFSGARAALMNRVEIVHAPDVITNDDVPTMAIKQKKESSLVRALEILKTREDAAGFVTAGSTGATLTGAVLKVGRIEGISRPALAPIMPTLKGTPVCLIDCGANVDSRPEFLVHFALMGDAYMRSVYGTKEPRVALLSNGVEDKKGNELVREAHALIKNLKNINFVGNMEAREALSGDYDVIVTDGFAGNILVKSIEGSVTMVIKSLKRAIMASKSAKIGSLFMKKAFASLKKDLDYNSLGGAPFLGVEKVIIKSHGSSDRVSISSSILQAKTMADNELVAKIKLALNQSAQD